MAGPADQRLTAFQGVQAPGAASLFPLTAFPSYALTHTYTRDWAAQALMEKHVYPPFYTEGRRRQVRPLELNSHSRAPSTEVVSHQGIP